MAGKQVSQHELDLYEIAYLCGGPVRVALVATVSLCRDGRIKIAPSRRIVTAQYRYPRGPVEAATMDAIPDCGVPLRRLLARIVTAPAVLELATSLRDRGLPARRLPSRGRRLRRRLIADPGTGLRRVAVLGVPGIEDAELRRIFQRPFLQTESRKRLRRTNDTLDLSGEVERLSEGIDNPPDTLNIDSCDAGSSGGDFGGDHGAGGY